MVERDTPSTVAACDTDRLRTRVSLSVGILAKGRPSRLPCALRPRKARVNPLHDPLPLERRDGREQRQLQPPGRRARVDALPERREGDPERLEIIERHDQMAQVPPKPIQLPAHQHVELPAAGVDQELVERRPAFLRAADAVIDILHCGPASRGAVTAQLNQLVLGLLIERGNASVDGSSHGYNLACFSAHESSHSRLKRINMPARTCLSGQRMSANAPAKRLGVDAQVCRCLLDVHEPARSRLGRRLLLPRQIANQLLQRLPAVAQRLADFIEQIPSRTLIVLHGHLRCLGSTAAGSGGIEWPQAVNQAHTLVTV